MPGHTERDFETAIEAGLTKSGGYGKRVSQLPLTKSACLVLRRRFRLPEEKANPQNGSALEDAARAEDHRRLHWIDLSKELELKGTLHILRHGFKCYGKTFRMAYFRPNTRMNPESAENYAKNRLTITRQVAFTSVMKKADGNNRRCIIDVTLAVNGIPVVTAELKNPLTGQRAC